MPRLHSCQNSFFFPEKTSHAKAMKDQHRHDAKGEIKVQISTIFFSKRQK